MSTESKPTPKREIILSLQFLFETVSRHSKPSKI
jgi:hypothetical protein